MPKREVELVIISDIHLGTYGCHAKELLRYLKSIKPQKLVLNGDIIDMWQFSKNYWPESINEGIDLSDNEDLNAMLDIKNLFEQFKTENTRHSI